MADPFHGPHRELADHGGSRQRQPQQYDLLHPQFNLAPFQIPQRDRYRTSNQFEEIQDNMALEEQGMTYDEFDEYLLNRPHDDRVKQATRGQARLSLAPRVSASVASGRPTQGGSYFNERKERADGGRHPHQRTHPWESSSDTHFEASSSPALKASQRRAETIQGQAQHRLSQQLVECDTSNAEDTSFAAKDIREGALSIVQKASSTIPATQSARPVCQGITLIAVSELPDRLRSIFPFPAFNAVQSKCYASVFSSDNNFVLASPTGSGKTAVLELAICRAFIHNACGQYKIVYQAPTKALCSERQRDWQKKFNNLGLSCVELTGDSDYVDVNSVQRADVIVTTPEKWDSITRKWKDHEKLMRLIKLFLIDEVHILKEERGAILEAVVSRMKTIGADVRFVALSATVPNVEDVATWLGRSAIHVHQPAALERFGEEFRPVKLKKHVCGYHSTGNDFQFERFLDKKLPEVISKYSERKPIMVFCFTRASAVKTAKLLSDWHASSDQRSHCWQAPSSAIQFHDRELRECALSGVAFHHAGLDNEDRISVEQGYLNGKVSVICCTSTLAVGINLPCHLVIVKNTVTFSNGTLQEYSDLEVVQMLGRAGRPQFDDCATAVIMTRSPKTRHYEMMVSGQELLESNLHLGLIDHLNAEVGLGTIYDLNSARKWLSGTFLYVRLKQNPHHYRLQGSRGKQSLDKQLDDICLRDLELLQHTNLVTGGDQFRSTEFGLTMARYYVQFKTMQAIIGLPPKAQISEIVSVNEEGKGFGDTNSPKLSALAQAAEFKEIRFRNGEKGFYKSLNHSTQMRFPIPVTLDLPAHKVSVIIQSVLGAADIIWDSDTNKHRNQYNTDANAVFKHATRLIRCIIDYLLELKDAVAVGHALMVERSLCSRAWDDVPVHMKQIPDIGNVSVRKLINAGIKSIEELEYTDAQRIEAMLGRNPPFGMKILEKLKSFPKLRVSVNIVPNSIKRIDEGVEIKVRINFGFLNEKPPQSWKDRSIYVCMMLERSDGYMVHFARISGKRLGPGQELVLQATLMDPQHYLNCHVMCNEIAGTMRQVTVKPKVAPSMFPAPKSQGLRSSKPASNIGKRRIDTDDMVQRLSRGSDEFGDGGLDDDDLLQASRDQHETCKDLEFDHIENYSDLNNTMTRNNTARNASSARGASTSRTIQDENEPQKLDNGNWACKHTCKDKSMCKHMCCREGLEKLPKKKQAAGKAPRAPAKSQPTHDEKRQMKLSGSQFAKKRHVEQVEIVDLTGPSKKRKQGAALKVPKEMRDLEQLHNSAQDQGRTRNISSISSQKPTYQYGGGGEASLSFLTSHKAEDKQRPASSDYGDIPFEDLGATSEQFNCDCSEKDEESHMVRALQMSNSNELHSTKTRTHIDIDYAEAEDERFSIGMGIGDQTRLPRIAVSDYEEDHNSLNVRPQGAPNRDRSDECASLGARKPDKPKPATLSQYEAAKKPSFPPSNSVRNFMFQSSSDPAGDQAEASISHEAKPTQREDRIIEVETHQSRSEEPQIRERANTKDQSVGSKTLIEINRRDEDSEAFAELEAWVLQEFGDIVELTET